MLSSTVNSVASRLVEELSYCNAGAIWKWKTRKLELSGVGEALPVLKCETSKMNAPVRLVSVIKLGEIQLYIHIVY